VRLVVERTIIIIVPVIMPFLLNALTLLAPVVNPIAAPRTAFRAVKMRLS
jgi:hypothetical protein